jgi:Transcription factor WhiB
VSASTSLEEWIHEMPWMAAAECAGEPIETFYPPARSFSFARARAICACFEVIDDCRRTCDRAERGRPLGELHGLFAGESPKERACRRDSPQIRPKASDGQTQRCW